MFLEEIDFLRAIRANKNDDTLRLMYADFLQGEYPQFQDCGTCAGSGKVKKTKFSSGIDLHWDVQVQCKECNGEGHVLSYHYTKAWFIREQIKAWHECIPIGRVPAIILNYELSWMVSNHQASRYDSAGSHGRGRVIIVY